MHKSITLIKLLLLCLTLSFLTFILKCQVYDNPVSSSYEGNYALKVLWEKLSEQPLEILKIYKLSIKDVGDDKFFTIELNTEPKVDFVFKQISSDSGVYKFEVMFLQSFSGKLQVTAIRPNMQIDSYDTTVSVVNPYVIKGNAVSGKNVPASLFIERIDSTDIPDSSEFKVRWDTLSTCFSYGYINDTTEIRYNGRDTVTVTAFLKVNNDSSLLDPFTICFKGKAPEISASLQEPLKLGQAPVIKLYFNSYFDDKIDIKVYADSYDNLLADISDIAIEDAVAIVVCSEIITDTSVTNIGIVAINSDGLSSEHFFIEDSVDYLLPDAVFMTNSDTVFFRYGETPKFRAVGDADTFLWNIDKGVLIEKTTADSIILSKITDTMMHVIILNGLDTFGLAGKPDTIYYRARETRYLIKADESNFPSEIKTKKDYYWKVKTFDNYGKEISNDSVRYLWTIPGDSQNNQLSFSKDSSTLHLKFKDSIPSFTIEVYAIVGTTIPDTTVPLTGKIKTRVFRPKCDIDYGKSSDSVKILDSVSFCLTPLDTSNHDNSSKIIRVNATDTDMPDGHIATMFYSVNSDVVQIVQMRSPNEVWGYKFIKKGTYTINVWAQDDMGHNSLKDNLIFYVTTDKPVFENDLIDTSVYICDTLDLIGLTENDPDSIKQYLWDFNNDNICDTITDTNIIRTCFKQSGSYSVNLSCINLLNDTSAVPLTFNINVLNGIPVISSVSRKDTIFINDPSTFQINAFDSGTNGSVTQYFVSFDNNLFDSLGTDKFDTIFTTAGLKRIYCKVKDNLNQLSDAYTDSFYVSFGEPAVNVVSIDYQGTNLYVRDDFSVKFNAFDVNGYLKKAYISFNGDSIAEDSIIINGNNTNYNDSFSYAFDTSSYGEMTLGIWVVDDDNVKSLTCKRDLYVKKGAPVIQSVSPLSLWVIDNTKFTVTVFDTNMVNKKDLHTEVSMDSGKTWKSLINDTFYCSFDTSQAGERVLKTRVTDEDSLVTVQDYGIIINMGRPVIGGFYNNGNEKIRWISGAYGAVDTMVFSWVENSPNTTVVVDTSDSNGQCSRFFWDWDEISLNDTTTTINWFTKYVTQNIPRKVTVTAWDDDGIPSYPYQFVVLPDQVPNFVTMVHGQYSGDTVAFRWKREIDVTDGDNVKVQLMYNINGAGSWIPVFNGVLPTLKEIEGKYGTVLINNEIWNVYKHVFQTPFAGNWKVVLIDCHNNESSSAIGTIAP